MPRSACFFFSLRQFAPSSPRACMPSLACMTGRQSTCSCPSAERCTSASSPRPSPSRRPTSLWSSWGLSSRMLWWEWSTTTDGPSLSTCTVLTQVGNLFALLFNCTSHYIFGIIIFSWFWVLIDYYWLDILIIIQIHLSVTNIAPGPLHYMHMITARGGTSS